MFAARRFRGAAALLSVGGSVAACHAKLPFEAKGQAEVFQPAGQFGKSAPLKLAGAGMRKKNLYVVEVDVYVVGLYLSQGAVKAAKDVKAKDAELGSLPEELAKLSRTQKDGSPVVATQLTFVRDVGQSSIVEAFNDAFAGCDKAAVDSFKKAFAEAVGSAGMKKGESFTFMWAGAGGGLALQKNGAVSIVVNNANIENKLLEVYLSPSKTVSPELCACIKQHIQCIA
jgi:hypothetical protein